MSTDAYLDNNNFLSNQAIFTRDHRLNILESRKQFNYIEVKPNPSWKGKPLRNKEKRSYDDGKTFKTETTQILAGQYYFLYEYKKTSSRTAYNYVMFAAYIGALSGLVMKLFNHCAKRINSNEIKYR